MEFVYNEKTGDFEYVNSERSKSSHHSSHDTSYSGLISNATIKRNLEKIKSLAREGKTYAARKFFVDEFGCTWDEAQNYLNKIISPTENIHISPSTSYKNLSSSPQTLNRSPHEFNLNDYYIQSNKTIILQLYNNNKTFAARKYFVDAFGCTWEQAFEYLIMFVESCGNPLSKSHIQRQYNQSKIESNKSKILSLYQSGKTFAARKYFVDEYNCTWEEASVKLQQFVNENA